MTPQKVQQKTIKRKNCTSQKQNNRVNYLDENKKIIEGSPRLPGHPKSRYMYLHRLRERRCLPIIPMWAVGFETWLLVSTAYSQLLDFNGYRDYRVSQLNALHLVAGLTKLYISGHGKQELNAQSKIFL